MVRSSLSSADVEGLRYRAEGRRAIRRSALAYALPIFLIRGALARDGRADALYFGAKPLTGHPVWRLTELGAGGIRLECKVQGVREELPVGPGVFRI